MSAETGSTPSHAAMGRYTNGGPKRVAAALNRLAEVVDPGDWIDQSACVGHDPNMWWPSSSDGRSAAQVELDTLVALRICRGCPVRRECAEFAQTNREREGIWGGVQLIPRSPRREADDSGQDQDDQA